MKPFKTLLTACLIAALFTTPVFLSLVFAIPARAMEVKRDGYPIPSLDGYAHKKTFSYDASKRVPGEETSVELWKNRNGDKIYLGRYNGDVYFYFYIPRKNKNSGYCLVAWEKPKVFEQKYGYNEEWDILERLLN